LQETTIGAIGFVSIRVYPCWGIFGTLLKVNVTLMELIDIIKRILNTDADIRFLAKLNESELKTLIACIRDRVNQIQEE